MNVRLTVVTVMVWSQGLGWGSLNPQALANSVQNPAHPLEIPQTNANADSVSVPVRTVPFTAEEIPEEILRTEIITEARSPLTGEPISAADYAQLTDELRAPAGGNLVSQDIDYLIYLLQIRRAIKPILPFL